VITSFSAASDSVPAQVKLLILQPVSGTTYNVVAKSDAGTFTATGVQTFPTQISVRAGQVIGDWGRICSIDPTGNAADHFHNFMGGDPTLGAPQDFPLSSSPGTRVNLSANLEPSAAAPGPAPGPGTSGAAQKKCKKQKHRAAAAKKKHCKKKKK
jgi:hypothetical protein